MRMTAAVLLAIASAVGAGAWGSPAHAQVRIPNCRNIDQSGSYILVNNLFSSGGCLTLETGFVTIDLNGFGIFGFGTGAGITSDVDDLHITVRNGTISNFEVGILLGGSARVEGVQANGNATAIEVGEGSTVTGNKGIGNERVIVAGGFSTVTANTAFSSVTVGIIVGEGSTVSSNIASRTQPDGDGIVVGESSTVNGNTTSDNGRHGLVVGEGSTVSGNTASRNGQDGIRVGRVIEGRIPLRASSTVSGNTASGNGRDGIVVGFHSTVSGNTASENRRDGILAHCPMNIIGNTATANGDQEIELVGVGRNFQRFCPRRQNLVSP